MDGKNVVWESTLDGRYEVAVTRTVPYQGELTISEAGQVLFHQPVGLMYNAIFGPDIADVEGWQEAVVNFVDGKKA